MQWHLTTPETMSLDIVAAAGASVSVVAEVHHAEEEEEVRVEGNTPVLFSFLSEDLTKRYMV